MPMIETAPGIQVHVSLDNFTDPWVQAPTVLMIHGLAECGEAFRAFVPALSRHARVARLDLRGYGASPALPADHPWRFDTLIEDVVKVIAALGVAKVHLVGGKIGGTIALAVAARHPSLVDRLAVLGAPASLRDMISRTPSWREQIARDGVLAWVRATNAGRMGSRMTPAQLEWWAQMMGRTAASTLEGFLQMVPGVDVTAEVDRIVAPTLVVTTTGSGLGSVETVRAWQERIPQSDLVVLENDSYHVAASDPDETAALVREFLFAA
ncbi:alpha/beta fold hydrolase [Neoroseomonas soli]|uniref:Alpha/beta hydrolase n=1 Tax=Neoroseomonas soli TaxID=1081025 RepID=A0A9X9WR55_9PROT|nr:alpha/beta hydrolase [Neoroseomonas soli]MBR0669634.1 alpha/beta hydrolase [Neoroseomonas soli]